MGGGEGGREERERERERERREKKKRQRESARARARTKERAREKDREREREIRRDRERQNKTEKGEKDRERRRKGGNERGKVRENITERGTPIPLYPHTNGLTYLSPDICSWQLKYAVPIDYTVARNVDSADTTAHKFRKEYVSLSCPPPPQISPLLPARHTERASERARESVSERERGGRREKKETVAFTQSDHVLVYMCAFELPTISSNDSSLTCTA